MDKRGELRDKLIRFIKTKFLSRANIAEYAEDIDIENLCLYAIEVPAPSVISCRIISAVKYETSKQNMQRRAKELKILYGL